MSFPKKVVWASWCFCSNYFAAELCLTFIIYPYTVWLLWDYHHHHHRPNSPWSNTPNLLFRQPISWVQEIYDQGTRSGTSVHQVAADSVEGNVFMFHLRWIRRLCVYIYTVIVCKYSIFTYTYIVHIRIYTIPSYIWRISWFEWLKASLPIFLTNQPVSMVDVSFSMLVSNVIHPRCDPGPHDLELMIPMILSDTICWSEWFLFAASPNIKESVIWKQDSASKFLKQIII